MISKDDADYIKENWSDLTSKGDECEGYRVADVFEDGSGRWTAAMTSIIQVPSGEFFKMNWERGLTEYQDDSLYSIDRDPVTRVTKMVEVTEWV